MNSIRQRQALEDQQRRVAEQLLQARIMAASQRLLGSIQSVDDLLVVHRIMQAGERSQL